MWQRILSVIDGITKMLQGLKQLLTALFTKSKPPT